MKKLSAEHQEVERKQEFELKEEISDLNFVENEIRRNEFEFKYSYEELMKENEKLIKANSELKNKLDDRDEQLKEITMELKGFNVMLEEEIAERSKTEEALKVSERQFRYAIEEAPLPIMLYTENGEVKKINRNGPILQDIILMTCQEFLIGQRYQTYL